MNPKYLLVLLLCATGCKQGKLLVVDDGNTRQYFWDGGDKCGDVSYYGEDVGSILATDWSWDGEQNTFVRKADAIRWIETKCPDATPVDLHGDTK